MPVLLLLPKLDETVYVSNARFGENLSAFFQIKS